MYLSSISSRLLWYDTNNWDLKKCHGIEDGILRDISWSDDSKYLLQVNCKGVVEIFGAADDDVQHIAIEDSWSAAFHRDGHGRVAIGTKSGNVQIWDTDNKYIMETFPSPTSQCDVSFISYNATNTILAAAMANGDTVIFGLLPNTPVLIIKLPYSKSISSMKFHTEYQSLLGLTTDEGHVLLRDVNTSIDKVFFGNIHASPVSDLAFSIINKDVMLSTGYDKLMNIYDIRLQNVVSTLRSQYTLTALSLNMENQVALGTQNGLVLVYDLRDLSTPLKVLEGHKEEVRRVAFQPIRKKLQSSEINLKEAAETHMSVIQGSLVNNSTSESLEKIILSPNSTLQEQEMTADSFLAMMTINKSNYDSDEESNKTLENHHEVSYDEFVKVNDINKTFTPTTNNIVDDVASSIQPQSLLNELPDDADSFLAMMTINKSNYDSDEESNKTLENHHEVSDDEFVKVNDINKTLTPTTNNIVDDVASSIQPQSLLNELPDDARESNSNNPEVNSNNAESIDACMDELKDFINLAVYDIRDHYSHNYLSMMMAFTKQKLYLEKQMSNINDKLNTLVELEGALMESNRMLILKMNQLRNKVLDFNNSNMEQ